MKNIIGMMKGFLFLIMIVMLTSFLFAEPTGPSSITEGSSGTRGANAAFQLEAQAGNVTALTIDATSVTKSWQGYYGNISGAITLDDASNYTMYDWVLASPQGEVYASNFSLVTWANIKCVNYTGNPNGGLDGINLTVLESMYGMNSWDPDGVNETFNSSYVDATGFYVGSVQINTADVCPLAYAYVNESYQTTSFKEVLLTDNVSIIFTALIEEDVDGYKTGADPNDFQMLVGQNGHIGGTDTTTYYFFAEIE